MIGQNALLALRARRLMPAHVHVNVLDLMPAHQPCTHPERSLENGWSPCIEILPSDNPETLDLRVLRGITVHLGGRDWHRVMTVMDRIAEFEPARILAVRPHSPENLLDWTAETGLVEHDLEPAQEAV